MAGLRWVVKDGAVCLPPADGADTRGHRDMISAGKYGDFDLTWEWQVQAGSNSGLKYFVLEDGPAAILDILAVLSTFAMGAYCLLLLGTNNLLLPKKIRPNIFINILLAFAALFYLGMLAYSYFRFGVIL